MPNYAFRDENDTLIVLTMPIAEMEAMKRGDEYEWEGRKVRRDYQWEHQSTFHSPGNWPMVSESMAVAPDQIGEAVAHDRKLGVSVNYDPLGRPVFESAGQRKRYCEAHGVYDRNGGYGDPQKRR